MVMLAGYINHKQQNIIEYLIEENRVLQEKLGPRRILLNDDQRRRLAIKGKALEHKLLGEVAGFVTPDTILRWHRKLVAMKYDGSWNRKYGRRIETDRDKKNTCRKSLSFLMDQVFGRDNCYKMDFRECYVTCHENT